RLGGRVAHGAVGDDRVRLLRRAGARLAAPRPRGARPGRNARSGCGPRRGDGDERPRHPAGRARRRARAGPRTVPGHRGGHHAGQLVGLWSVRHSDPLMYRETDGEMLALLAPQLALLLAIEASVQPVVGASERTTTYIETLTATTEEIHASSQEVAAAAQRA